MNAKLLDYPYVPPGFEIVISSPDLETGRVWNLWWNIRLSDDPASWDDAIRHINAMQSKLGQMSDDHRLIRAQMAAFCRLNPLFPGSVELLCEEIGSGSFSRPLVLGCEGRGLLQSLGYQDPQSVKEQRLSSLAGSARSLDRWLAQARPETPEDWKVFGFLGQPTSIKVGYVDQLYATLDRSTASIAPLKEIAEGICKQTQGEAIFEGAARPLNCFRCDGCSVGESGPGCGCCSGMLVDAALLCAGVSGGSKAISDSFGRFVQENVLAYCLALNSWLRAVPPEPVTSMTSMRYMDEMAARQLAGRVYACLGEKDEAKEWLAACLLKTLKENQRWHKREELIDAFPQATSWLSENLPA